MSAFAEISSHMGPETCVFHKSGVHRSRLDTTGERLDDAIIVSELFFHAFAHSAHGGVQSIFTPGFLESILYKPALVYCSIVLCNAVDTVQ